MFVDTFKPYLDLRNKKIQKYLRELHFKSRGTAMHLQFAEAVKNFSLTQDPEKLVDENENLHIDNIDQITIFDSTPIFFQKLKKKGRTISICTNRQVGSMSKILENNKLVTKIDNVVSCIDVGHEKPDPYCLLDLIKRSGIPKDKTIYFGDSKTDFEFAKNANVDFIIIDHYMNQKRFYTMILETFMQ
jgi:phosphoglycolate phosphatase-like HAD superfamily hydrolase